MGERWKKKRKRRKELDFSGLIKMKRDRKIERKDIFPNNGKEAFV